MGRRDVLQNILKHDPANKLAGYGLAMEMVNEGELDEGVRAFRNLVEHHPDYAYAFFQCGQALERLGRTTEAKETYAKGIAAAERTKDPKARSEIQSALDLLG